MIKGADRSLGMFVLFYPTHIHGHSRCCVRFAVMQQIDKLASKVVIFVGIPRRFIALEECQHVVHRGRGVTTNFMKRGDRSCCMAS